MDRCVDCGRICDDYLCNSCRQERIERLRDYDDQDE